MRRRHRGRTSACRHTAERNEGEHPAPGKDYPEEHNDAAVALTRRARSWDARTVSMARGRHLASLMPRPRDPNDSRCQSPLEYLARATMSGSGANTTFVSLPS